MSKSPFTFYNLTPELIDQALLTLDLHAISGLTVLNSYENRVYRFTDEQQQHYLVKFYRPERWKKEQILEEHQLLKTLNEAQLAVVAPLTIHQRTLHFYQGYFFTIYPYLSHRSFALDNIDQLVSAAQLIGQIHHITKQHGFIHRPAITIDAYLREPQAILATSSLVPMTLRDHLDKTLNQIIDIIQRLWPTSLPLFPLHGDCHAGNLLWRDQVFLVDFDDAHNGPAIQDLWMLLHGSTQEQQYQLTLLLEAYEEATSFDRRQFALIEPLRTMRMVHYLAWVVRRWQDAAFVKNFPWFREEEFWQQQLTLLKQQLLALQLPPLQLMAVY